MSSVLVALRRLRDDRAPAIGLGLLILVTATLFGLAPRLIERVADDALHGVVRGATAIQRNFALLEEQVLPPGEGDPLEPINEEGDRLDTKVPASIRALVGERLTVVDSARFEIQADHARPVVPPVPDPARRRPSGSTTSRAPPRPPAARRS